jgi:hypothetical protein
MDLNYLFHRQQVERTRADAAKTDEARVAHEQLARCYEAQINDMTGGDFALQPQDIEPLLSSAEAPRSEAPSAAP